MSRSEHIVRSSVPLGSPVYGVSDSAASVGAVADSSAVDLALNVEGLTKTFGRRKALADCTFSLPQGSTLVVVGPNGAGKTTLLRMLALLDRPSEGSMHILDCDVHTEAENVRGLIGLVSHAPMVYLDLTAEENLLFYARMYGVEDPQQRVRELLDYVELSTRRHDAVRGFSRGMTQRLCIARALVHDPALVLLDEPYAGLDQHAARFVDALLTHKSEVPSKRAERTVVSVTHAVERGFNQASHVLVLEHGHQRLFAPTAKVDYAEVRTLLGEELGEEVLS